jgi:hypothetical protein
MTKRETVFLVIRVDKTVRAAKKPRIAADEVAVRIDLNYPDSWGKVLSGNLEVNVPDFAPEVASEQVQEPVE